MRIGEALIAYRSERKLLVQQQRELCQQRNSLEKRMTAVPNGQDIFGREAATLELSIDQTRERFEENLKVLDRLIEEETAVFNGEVARQQSDVMQEYAEDLVKIMEVARRISNGDIVPATDEKKLLDYSFELYQAAKNMGSIARRKDREEYDSLWEDEDEEQQEYDPEGKAFNAETDVELPASMTGGGESSAAVGAAEA
ncbi:MAG: hypothetical protein J6B43_04905 [Lachnospiraceae bacterium]|nr:hypothetical protein [Lachnospiraceae bacterium]